MPILEGPCGLRNTLCDLFHRQPTYQGGVLVERLDTVTNRPIAESPAHRRETHAVSQAFQALVPKNGLYIPYQCPDCFRESNVVHLLV